MHNDIVLLRAYFRRLCIVLEVDAPYPPRLEVERALRTHLPRRVQRFGGSIDRRDVRQWLTTVLLTDQLIRLEGCCIAVRVLTRAMLAEEGLLRVSSEPFEAARLALGIERYYFVVLEVEGLPRAAAVLEGLYEAFRRGRTVDAVEIGG